MEGELVPIFAALGLTPTAAQAQALTAYLDLLQHWNATYNLTAVREREAMLSQHLADCLAVLPPLVTRCANGRVLDVGSGGGLPGAVLAIMVAGLDVTCVDTVGKKAAFIRQVAGSLKLANLHSIHVRVESLVAPPFDLICSRAFASLADFVRLTRGHLSRQGVWMAMKGRRPDDEIAALPADIDVFHVEHLTVPGLDAERCLVWMRIKAVA
ncbi:methyltransferase, SAM-dependent methyltransferase, glucose-inhibited cell-division protein [Rubrivivax sp. A210]|uniref:16S rRNA (guanine(527)-N(7))-methyltransferase RsmG n=1 Tax=Rubrivivax sp. A210 TaxID=2772301 RepID=UPI00191B3865|nr:16S rRNA (guanine(527)-N(7))-methyltransferase RsmG [Rubrivivax sp. A210]CAD5373386.1 methyltransferase, SAM-dependent methyltransferase, glucose-inhibited cell-division protein [Rubrivivax sp. A210]